MKRRNAWLSWVLSAGAIGIIFCFSVRMSLGAPEQFAAFAGKSFDPHCGNNQACLVWAHFRNEHPFPYQAFSVAKAGDGSVVLIISEPAAAVGKKDLEKLIRTAFGADLIDYSDRRWMVGVDGWLEDVVLQLKPSSAGDPLQDAVLRDRIGFVQEVLYGTDYGAQIERADAKFDALARKSGPDISPTPAELRQWTEHAKGNWTALNAGSRPPAAGLNAILNGQAAGPYIDGEHQLVMLAIPRRTLDAIRASDAAMEKLRAPFRMFAVASDAMLGGAWNENGGLVLIARTRRVPAGAMQPLRFETFAALAREGASELQQSYERNSLFAGKLSDGPYRGLDWAPVLLSNSLIDTEFGALLNIADQFLKSWSEAGDIGYLYFDYPLRPRSGQFVFGSQPLSRIVYKEVGGHSVLYNWNTAGAAVSLHDQGLTVLAAGRTSALPVTYGSDAQGAVMKVGNELPKLRAREETAYSFFAAQRDPNLARVVSYTLIYQIFQGAPAGFSGRQSSPIKPAQARSAALLASNADKLLANLEGDGLAPRSGVDAARFRGAVRDAKRALAEYYARQGADRRRLALLLTDPHAPQAAQNTAADRIRERSEGLRNRSLKLQTRVEAFNRVVGSNNEAVNRWLADNSSKLPRSVSNFDQAKPYLPAQLRSRLDWMERERAAIGVEKNALTTEQRALETEIKRIKTLFARQKPASNTEILDAKLNTVAEMAQSFEPIRAAFVAANKGEPTGRIKTPSIVLSRNLNDLYSVGGHNLTARTLRIEVARQGEAPHLGQAPDGARVLYVPRSTENAAAAHAHEIARKIEHEDGDLNSVARFVTDTRPAPLRTTSVALGKPTVDLAQLACGAGCLGLSVSSPLKANLIGYVRRSDRLSAVLERNKDGYFTASERHGAEMSCCRLFADSKSLEAFLIQSLKRGNVVVVGESDDFVTALAENLAVNDPMTAAKVRGTGGIRKPPKPPSGDGSFQIFSTGPDGGRPSRIEVFSDNRPDVMSAALGLHDLRKAVQSEKYGVEARAIAHAYDGTADRPSARWNDARDGAPFVVRLELKAGNTTTLQADVVAGIAPAAMNSGRSIILDAVAKARMEPNLVRFLVRMRDLVGRSGVRRLFFHIHEGKHTFRFADNEGTVGFDDDRRRVDIDETVSRTFRG